MTPATEIPTRDRILCASVELPPRQGYGGTGLELVLGRARAPFTDACPPATVAGEIASTHDRMRQSTALALLEGCVLLSRSTRSLEPMYAAAAAASTRVAADLERTE